jgi:hypothetical protein
LGWWRGRVGRRGGKAVEWYKRRESWEGEVYSGTSKTRGKNERKRKKRKRK